MKLDRFSIFSKKLNETSKKEFEYYVGQDYLEELFQTFKYEDYILDIEKSYFIKKDDKIEQIDLNEDYISKGSTFHIGWTIDIRIDSRIKYNKEDITNDFKSIIKKLYQIGYKVKIKRPDEEEDVDSNTLHFRSSRIIVWIPEKRGVQLPTIEETKDFENLSDGDIYDSLSSIKLEIYQTEEYVLESNLDLAKFYKWKNYKVVNNNNIYCEVDIEDMANLFLSRNSGYDEILSNGNDDCSDYYNNDYVDIEGLFRYYLSKEQEDKISQYVMKTIKLEEILEFIELEFDEDLSESSVEEVRKYLLKNCLDDFCKERISDLELVDEILKMANDYEGSAHCDADLQAIYDEFDRKLKREGIVFDKEWKMSQRYFYTKNDRGNLIKKHYDDMNWVYKLYFDENWITDFGSDPFFEEDLYSIFYEWANNYYAAINLNPYFKYSGNVDKDSMLKDFDYLIKSYLKE